MTWQLYGPPKHTDKRSKINHVPVMALVKDKMQIDGNKNKPWQTFGNKIRHKTDIVKMIYNIFGVFMANTDVETIVKYPYLLRRLSKS